VRPFERLTRQELTLVAEIVESRAFDPGEIVHQGERPLPALYVTIGGSLVRHDNGRVAATLNGLTDLLTYEPSPALHAGAAGARLLVISQGYFFTLMQECPEFLLGLITLPPAGGRAAMTTRRHIVLLVLPVFTLLALMGGALMAWMQLTAVQRDFHTEVRTLAVAVRVGADADSLAALEPATEIAEPYLAIVFRRILHWEQVHRIQVVSDLHGVVFDSAPEPPASLPEPTTPTPDFEGIAWLPLTSAIDGRPIQPVSASATAPGWRINLEVDATAYATQHAAVWRAVAWFAAACLVVGLVPSLLLAHFVAAQFRRLAAHAAQISEDNFDPTDSHTRIQEIADVNDTLAAMHSVLHETLERSQRALEISAPPPTDRLATQVFRHDELPFETWTEGNVRGATIRVGHPLAVAGQAQTGPDQGFAFVGVMPDDTLLASARRARAAQEALTQAFRRHYPDTAVAAIARLFALPELAVMRWREGHWQQSRHGTHQAESPPAGAWGPGPPVIVTCLGPADLAHLHVYQNACAGLDFERLVSDLPVVLRGSPPGLVLIVQTVSSTTSAIT